MWYPSNIGEWTSANAGVKQQQNDYKIIAPTCVILKVEYMTADFKSVWFFFQSEKLFFSTRIKNLRYKI